jgi:hypothetical protein
MHPVASTGFAVGVIGAILFFAVGGGLWSDVPGGVLMTLGFLTELLATGVILLRRLSR